MLLFGAHPNHKKYLWWNGMLDRGIHAFSFIVSFNHFSAHNFKIFDFEK